MRLVFLDTETTGLSPESGDRIVEIGCVELVGRRPTGRHLHLYLNPERPSHPDALRIHGLTDEFLSDKPRFDAVVDELLAFVSGAEVVIHNAGFDVNFLDHELRRIDRPRFGQAVTKITDSLAMAREMFPGKANSLDALCRRLEVDNSHRSFHGALLDAGLLAEVYVNMTRGQKSFAVEADDAPTVAQADQATDLSRIELPVIPADAEEAESHEAMLQELQKAAKGGAIWARAVVH